MNRNPEGRGGFQDHPELRSNGRWRPEDSYKYNINKFKAMSLGDFLKWKGENPNATMAQLAAYVRVEKAIDKLDEFKEAADRSEGKSKESLDVDWKGEDVHKWEIKIVRGKKGTPGDGGV